MRWLRMAAPSAITLGSVLAALLSLLWAPVQPYWACIAIVVASLCDMIDGRVARMLGASSAFGRELDSLADVIAFGVAPAFLLYHWRLDALGAVPGLAGVPVGALLAFCFVACSAVRLARFNVGTPAPSGEAAGAKVDDDTFVGVTTPVAALLLTTVVMTSHELDVAFLRELWFVVPWLLGVSLLMVSRIRFPSFKRFRRRAVAAAYFGSMAAGVGMLVLQRPGGAVLLALLVVYLARGLIGALVSRGVVSATRTGD